MLPMDRCLDWLILDSPEDLQALLTLVFGPNGDWSIAEDKSIVTLRVPKKKQ